MLQKSKDNNLAFGIFGLAAGDLCNDSRVSQSIARSHFPSLDIQYTTLLYRIRGLLPLQYPYLHTAVAILYSFKNI